MKMHPMVEGLIRGMSRAHTQVFRWIGPKGIGPFKQTLILRTKGRKTGRAIDTPLLYVEDAGKLYLVASFGGNDAEPGWYRNLKVHPDVEADLGAGSRRYTARTLSAEEAGPIWPKLLALYPTYASYQKKTTRVIPVIELAPA